MSTRSQRLASRLARSTTPVAAAARKGGGGKKKATAHKKGGGKKTSGPIQRLATDSMTVKGHVRRYKGHGGAGKPPISTIF